MNLSFWFGMQYFQNLAWNISNLFLSVYIWQNTTDPNFLYLYFISLFIAIPLAGSLAAIVSSRWSHKPNFTFSFILNSLLLFLVAKNSEIFLDFPVLFGVINGISIGVYSVASNSTKQSMFRGGVSKTTAKLSSASSLNSLAVPLIGAFIISKLENYSVVFVLGAISLLISTILVVFVNFSASVGSQTEKSNFWKYSDFWKLNLFSFVWGLKSGLEWSVFGIVILKLVGGEIVSWGVINFSAAVTGIAAGLIYSKYLAGKEDPLALIISSVGYTVLGIFLVSDYGLTNFVLYFLGSTVTSTFIGSSVTRLFSDVYSNISGGFEGIGTDKYYAILEYPLALGRVLPVAVLYMFQSDLNHNFVLVTIFFVVSTVPLVSTYIFQNMASFHKEVIEEF